MLFHNLHIIINKISIYRAGARQNLLFHWHISFPFLKLVLEMRAPVFRADLGSEAAVSSGAARAPHVILRQVVNQIQ